MRKVKLISLVWVKNNKVTAIAFPILCVIAITFNILKRPHIDEYKTGNSEIFTYVMGLLSIILTLSITEILTNGNLFLRFIVAKFLNRNKKKKKPETKRDKYTKSIHYLYICLLIFLLFFPIQYWYASYQVFHTKTDWSFFTLSCICLHQ